METNNLFSVMKVIGNILLELYFNVNVCLLSQIHNKYEDIQFSNALDAGNRNRNSNRKNLRIIVWNILKKNVCQIYILTFVMEFSREIILSTVKIEKV